MFPNQRWNENWRGKPDRPGSVVGKPESIDGLRGQVLDKVVVKDWRVDVHYNIPLSRPAAPREEKVSTNFDLCNARHDPSEIFGDGQITTHQFLQAARAVFPVIDGVEVIEAQQFGQAACVDLVILVAVPHGGILARIAHHQICEVTRDQQTNKSAAPS